MSGHRRRTGLTLVELLVAITVVAGLVGLLLPAVQAAREAARASGCMSHVRQLALAVAMHVDARRTLPQARNDGVAGVDIFGATPGPTWLWTIRPFLEATPRGEWPHDELYEQQPEAIRQQVEPLFLCPSRRSAATAISETSVGPPRLAPCGCILPGVVVLGGAVSDYAGNQGDLANAGDFWKGGHGTGTIVGTKVTAESHRPLDQIRLRDIQDGLSATLLIGEAHVRQEHLLRLPDTGPAYDGSQFQFISRVGGPGVGIGAGPTDDGGGTGWMAFGSWHPSGCQIAFADGRVGRLTTDLAPEILGSLCNRADGIRRADLP